MTEAESRALHLHTLESLLADLISGRSVLTGDGQHFALPDERTRSALEWYRKRTSDAWTANVIAQHAEDLVDAILTDPPQHPPLPARPANANSRRLRLKKVEAHRFAGVHKFGMPAAPPANFVWEFSSPLTLLDGRNGSGKTSLLNTIIWALTGELLRPQREPETAAEFECWIEPDGDEDQITHRLSAVTPMPDVGQYRPDQPWILADTWVELTFVDEVGAELPPVRRSLSRTQQGKLKETPPDLAVLAIDPIAVRIGTVMPGLLALIKVGSESELGRAVSQLTGLSALVDLAEHVRRARTKIDKEFVKAKTGERDRADQSYQTAKDDLEKILLAHPEIKSALSVPAPSEAKDIEQTLDAITKQFEAAKAAAYESARGILGESFDPAKPALLSNLERSIAGALERVSQPQSLPSAARLGALRQLTPEQLASAQGRIEEILAEADALQALAKDPSRAARIRLYARVATWIEDHPDPERGDTLCVVCGGALDQAVDPVTGQPVKAHIHEAASNAQLLSQTLKRWAESVQGDLLRSLPETLRSESTVDLPDHPCDLLRAAILDELFAFDPFRGVLGHLKTQTATAFDELVKDRAPLTEPLPIELPKGCDSLAATLRRLDRAMRFAQWRHQNEALARDIVLKILGRPPKEGESAEKLTLAGKLLDLDSTVKAAQPITDALVQCARLKQHLETRRRAELRLTQYAIASAALANLLELGELADEQVDQLRRVLRKEAAIWRERIYLGAYPDTAHELVDAAMGRKGELDLVVRSGGVLAPAQHVTNASALRASLVAFFLAFWEHVLKERGGLATLLLDDPQELLDDENRERLAASLSDLVSANAQVIVTSYDPRFCGRISRLPIPGGVEHVQVHPATRQQPVLRMTPPSPEILKRKKRFDSDRNDEETARDFADACRVFFEAKLGDMFDDHAHAAWAIANPNPTLATFLQRLRPLVRSSPQGMFSAHVFRRFVDHPALVDNSPVLELMNKAHHGRRQEIRAADVAQSADALEELLELVEQMSDECYRWRRRDAAAAQPATSVSTALAAITRPAQEILIFPDLAAFTQHGMVGESQESPERLDLTILDSKSAFYLRRPNFGFAAPQGSLAIVEAVPGPSADRRLVIVRHGPAVYARRLVRAANGTVLGLTAEIPDPRLRSPKTIFVAESEVAIHQVVGIIFDHSVVVEQGQDEAAHVDGGEVFKRVQIAYRVVDDSAVPLALPKQVVLGGARIELADLNRHEGALVALTLDDGSSIFKRLGLALPEPLAYLRQFESIGGLGSSQILSVGKPNAGVRNVTNVRAIVGVLYHG